MSTLVTRAGKGSPLTHNEVDTNFTNLNTDKVEKTSADITGGTINGTTVGATTPATGVFTTLTAQTESINGTGMNLVLYSQNYSFWNPNALTVTANSTTAPDSTNTASLLTANGSATQHYIFQAGTAGTISSFYPRTFSIYLRAGTNNFAQLLYGSDVNAYANFDLGTGALGTVGSTATATITSAGSGWYRCSVTTSSSLAAQNVYILIATGTSAVRFESNSLSTTIYSWGAQFEYGSTVRTYLVTTNSVVYNTPQLQFNNSGILQLQADGSVVVQPAGTGALQAQATTSSAVGGNARGANAVDFQTSRSVASRVASGTYSVLVGGQNNTVASSYCALVGGVGNTSNGFGAFVGSGNTNSTSGSYAFIGGGQLNTVSGFPSVVVGGSTNTAAGFHNFIGAGFTNSGTSGSAVTTQSATMNGTTAVTLSGSNASIKVGQWISGTSIADETYVAAISGTSLTLSKVASGSSTSTLSFFTPHGVVVGGGNNQATGSYSYIGGGGDAGTAANRNVASGDWSVVAGGQKNTATQIYATIGGGQNNSVNTSGQYGFLGGGSTNTVSGFFGSVIGGYGNVASGQYSTASGSGSSTRGIQGVFAASAGNFTVSADSQWAVYNLRRQTTDATPIVLATDTNVGSTYNQIILPNNSAYAFKGTVIANVTGAANGASWSFEGAIMRGANAASTVLMGTPAINRVAATAGATAWVIALTADTTNGGLAVTVTGAASTTIRWVASVNTVEVTF
jgi:hypothetical protein